MLLKLTLRCRKENIKKANQEKHVLRRHRRRRTCIVARALVRAIGLRVDQDHSRIAHR